MVRFVHLWVIFMDRDVDVTLSLALTRGISKDMQGRRVLSVTVRLDDDRNILIERDKKA